jgi:CspA family cold shock protein
MTGTIKSFDSKRQFGFITSISGEEIWLHMRRVAPEHRDRIAAGVQVEFRTVMEPKGKAAFDCKIIGAAKERGSGDA